MYVFLLQYVYSKGTVLDKTVEYLKELISQNEQLAGTAKLAEKSANALSLLQNQITVLEKENAFLRAQIIQFGIDAAASNSQPSNVNRQILNSPLAQSLLNTVAQASQNAVPAPQQPAPPPPPPPVGVNTQATTQQLLISLAQSLTNSPLLTAPAQIPSTLVSSVTASPPRLAFSAPSAAAAALAATSTPSRLTTPQQSAAVSLVTPQHLLQLPPQPAPPMQGGSPPQMTPLISSLVQTLASIANAGTSPVSKASPPISTMAPAAIQTPPPQAPPTSGGLSAAAAASLLNTLIMAQNVLTSTTGGVASVQGGGVSVGEAGSVLNSVGLEAIRRSEQ